MSDSATTRIFSAPWDRQAKVISLACAIALIAPALVMGIWIISLVAALAFAVAWAFSPRSYEVTPDSIIIKRFISNVTIPFTSLQSVHAAGAGDLACAVRLFGSGGLFGYYGSYRTLGLGQCSWYVTSRDNAVVLATMSGNVVVSPGDVDAFVAAFPEHHSTELPLLAPDSASTGTLWAIGLAILLGPAVVISLSLYNPAAPTVTLTSDAIAIHAAFGGDTIPAASLDIPGVRVLNLHTEPDWTPKRKTRGFRNAHYSSGLFRASNGKPVRVYAQNVDRLVFLPPKSEGTPVLVQVPQPEEFVNTVHRTWPALASRQ